jgi:hypothetical protein
MKRILPILTHSANYQYTLYKHKAIIQIPLNMYEKDAIPFKLSDLQPIILSNNSIIMCFNIPENKSVLKDIE